jgi:hypothetical protein
MQPTITRETLLVDRRQPSLRWSAVLAGVACSIAFWILLQLLGVGLGLASTDVDDVRSLRGAGIGATLWSLVTPLIAMFLGGMVAGKLAQTVDRKLAGTHALVMWALTSILGLCATIWIVSSIASAAGRHHGVVVDGSGPMTSWSEPAGPGAAPDLGIDIGELLAPINQRLASQSKPTIAVEDFEAALRGVGRAGVSRGSFDQELLVDQLIANTALSRADAIEVERQVEARLDAKQARANDVDAKEPRAHELEHRVQRHVLGSVDAAGKALTTVGLSLLLSLLAAVFGAIIALRPYRRPGEGPRGVRTTEPGFPAPSEPVTSSPPVPTSGTATATGAGRIIVPPTD